MVFGYRNGIFTQVSLENKELGIGNLSYRLHSFNIKALSPKMTDLKET